MVKQKINGIAQCLDDGIINAENANKTFEYYDCVYLVEGDLGKIGEMLLQPDVKTSLLNFIYKGKMLITEGLSGHIVSSDLSYLDFIVKKLEEEDKYYKSINYSEIETLGLTKERYIFHANSLIKKFKRAGRSAEREYRMMLNYLENGEYIVL